MPEMREIEGRQLKLSNLDKVLYPDTGFTKGQVIEYYEKIAPTILPHLQNRPITRKRYPDGVDAEFFFEKQTPSYRPDWFPVVEMTVEKSRTVAFASPATTADLVWLANLAALELHAGLQTADDLGKPTVVVFDLDPGTPATIVECCDVAMMLRDLLGELNLQCFPKTSGSKGMQLYVPINSKCDFATSSNFAHAIALLLEKQQPDLVVSNMAKKLRDGKVLIDWSQNSKMKTTIAPYSLRARSHPTVSTPIEWTEVEACAKSREPNDLVFEVTDVLERVNQFGDLFEPVLKLTQELPKSNPA